MLALIQELVSWAGPVFQGTTGYAIITVAVLAERSILLGLIIPGDVILALGGVYASRHRLDLAAVIILGATAAIIGESIGFWLGRTVGMRFIRHLPFLNRLEHRLGAAEEYFKKSGGMTVALGRYATAAGAFVPFAAGTGKMRYGRFLLWDIPAVVVWAVGITLIGYVFGSNLDTVEKILGRFGYIMLALLIAFFAVRFWQKRKASA